VKEKKMKSAAFGLHAFRETFRADDGAFVQAAHRFYFGLLLTAARRDIAG
jgi:hypothetical protein